MSHLFSSLRFRLLLLVLLAILPALGLIFYSGLEQRQVAAADAQAEALRLVRYAAHDQERMIQGAAQLLMAVAQLPAIREPNQAMISEFLHLLLKQNYSYTNIGIIGADGEVLYSALPFRTPVNYADTSWFKKALETRQLVIGEYQIGRISGKANVPLVYPVFDRAGRLQVMVYAGIDLRWISNLAAKVQLPPRSTLAIVDRHGTFLVRHPDPEKYVGQTIPDMEYVEKILAKGEGTIEARAIDGNVRLYGFTSLKDMPEGLFMRVGLLSKDVFAEANQVMTRNLIALSLVMVLSLAAAWLFGSVLIMRSVNTLVGATQQLAAGDLRVRTGLGQGGGEIHQLARAFDDMVDALEQREAQRQQAKAELAKLSLVASKTDNAVIITDKKGRIEWVNDGFTRLTGYSLAEAVGKRPGAFLRGPLSDPETIRRIDAGVRKKKPFTEEILNYNKQGQPFWISMDITPIYDDRGELVKFISIERDVTQKKETNEALRQAKEAADAANRAKTEFLASMSHEIRTPMNAIIGMAELLNETPLNPEQRKYVDIFCSAGKTLLNIINDILDFSKVEAGQISLENIDFDLRELVERVGEVQALRAHEKGLELACRLLPEVPVHLIGDPGRLRQVLTNLVGNAIKFTERGEVVVEVGLAESSPGLATESEQSTLLFSIKDTGIGIPRDKMDYIFEKFTQADASTTRRYGGTGLGLPITKQLVELMGGRITVESQPGQGSIFSFTLCLARQPEPKEPETVPVTDLRGLRVLIVDDNATNRLILRETLASWGAVADEAPDGVQGLEKLRKARDAGEPYRLVLLDYRMPGMNGFEVAEAIKQDPTLDGTTLLMLTSDIRGGDLATARKLGVEGYLVKPVKRAELREAINLALSRTHGQPVAPAPARPQVVEDQCALRILLVDDSADNRLLVESYLKTSPYHLELAENGQVAVEKFKSGKYDLVLMDMQMPVMDGYTATETIRQWESQSGLKPTPIIALTAFALKEEVQKSLDAGCNVHLTKPIKKAILLETIIKMCPGN